jgi:hypothetical protein
MADLACDQARDDLQGLRRRLRAIEDAIKFTASSTDRVGRATIEVGRDFLVRGLLKVIGDVSLLDADGNELVRLGDMPYGRGLGFYRENGVQAFGLSKPFSVDDQQRWFLTDRAGTPIVEESILRPGLGRPYLELPLQPVAAASGTAVSCGPYGWERTTSSTSWETLFAYDGKAQNGFLDTKFAVKCSDGSTSGEVQVIDDLTATPLIGFFLPAWLGTIPLGTTTMTVIDPTTDQLMTPLVTPGEPMRLAVQVRRTAGAGSITLAVPQSIGG